MNNVPFVRRLSAGPADDALAHALGGLTDAEFDRVRSGFDADWYLNRYPDVAAAGEDPFVHYMTWGWREERDPSPQFSTASYLERYPDVRDHGTNPFRHWLLYGVAEGRSGAHASPLLLGGWESLTASQQAVLIRMFGIDYYRANAPGPDGGLPAAEHVSSGRTDAGNATLSFRASRYVAAHPELLGTQQVPFLHFLFDTVGEHPLRDLFLALPPADVQLLCEHFDTAWYLYSYPDVEAAGLDAFIHYMTAGWRERRDPSPDFSTNAYLLRYPDIAECGMNPFLHWVLFGQAEGRTGASSSSNFRNRPYAPSVTAILVNTGDDPLSPDCLATVVRQSHRDLTVLIVGAPLPDACRSVLDDSPDGGGVKAIRHLADDGASPPWMSLRRAVDHADGELIWFVGGQGRYDGDFLARLTSSFADGSVQLGFGRLLEEGDAIGQEMSPLRMAGWKRHVTSPAATWFFDNLTPGALAGVRHGFLWRRRTLAGDVWRQAGEYRHLGHWHLYLHMASGGQIASVRDALVYVPSASEASPVGNGDLDDDVARLTGEIRSFWNDPHADDAAPPAGTARTRRHILIVTHGIFAGGAENFPIQLANALAGRGIIVSMMIFKTDDVNAEMRATLDPGVSIYEADWVLEHGCERFVRDIGCTLIHSHGVVGEMFFFDRCASVLPVPYVATLHGSYEASSSSDLPESVIARIVRNVDLFIYTADKNLKPLLRHGVQPGRLVKMINAMPVDEAPFSLTRAEMGIAQDAVVFTLVARGIREKGWSTAIDAFKAVRKRNPHRAMHLCLVGEGEEPDRLGPLHADDRSISFLGFQLRIHGLYRMTDVAIVPTRFAGESFPLCIIQALQAAVPVIATDVGEIASMLRNGGTTGGVVVEDGRLDRWFAGRFDRRFAKAMHRLVDEGLRKRLGSGAGVLGGRYDMDGLTGQYVDLYEDVFRRFAAAGPIAPR
ncbi:glycosyltransferase family 4 protein [Sphingomonas bacterium]|uniref:glycosyltransferase family 4 protein n=1 Tax=Sphingomonas bacterium TaxID=1895847 RepID=UPI0015767E1E|nr:glycosyltransferase family 4 protein [Sphingomonas bacterium]